MNAINDSNPNPIFIQDQRLSRLVLRPEDRGDKLRYLRSQHGGEAWAPREEFETFNNQNQNSESRWQIIKHRKEIFSQFQSGSRVLLAVTAYAGIGKSILLQQIDGLLPFACEGISVLRVEFSDLPDTWEQYIHTPWMGDDPFLVRHICDQLVNARPQQTLSSREKHDFRNWVEAALRSGNFVLLIDGLDEYNDPNAIKKAKQLRHLLLHVFSKLHCVVAGRPHAITQELWHALFSNSTEPTKLVSSSDFEFMRVEMFDREQLERFLGKETADQLKMLEVEIEFSARNLEALRTLDKATLATIRSTADLYWHSIVGSLPMDNREDRGQRLQHTDLRVDEVLHILSAIGITMALWHYDPRFPVHEEIGTDEFEAKRPLTLCEAAEIESKSELQANPGVMEVGGDNAPPMNEFRRRLFERLLEVYPDWRDIEPKTKRRLVEFRYEELIRLNSQYVEFGFLKEQDANRVRWRNAMVRDFFAALWMTTRANAVESDVFHQRMYVNAERDSSIGKTWQMICGMPTDVARLCQGANDSEHNQAWLRMIHPLFQPRDREIFYFCNTPTELFCFDERPTELMYRSWPGLLMRAGFLWTREWTEYDLFKATTFAQRYFDRSSACLPTKVSLCDKNACKVVGSFLLQYPTLRYGSDERSQIIAEDMEDHWRDCNSSAGMKVRVGHSKERDNLEREVVLPDAFSMCANQVTNRLYELFDPCYAERCTLFRESSPFARGPADALTWCDAMMFSIWCHGYLPSEWEWEYASRAECRNSEGGNARFFWGDDEKRAAEYLRPEYRRLTKHRLIRCEEGDRVPNAFGLYDTLADASEWCRNRYVTERAAWRESEAYAQALGACPLDRVLRGGSVAYLERAGCSVRECRLWWDSWSRAGLRVYRTRTT